MAGYEIMNESDSRMTKERLQYLLNRYLTNTATEEELQEYTNWYGQQEASGGLLFEEMDNEQSTAYKQELFNSIINNIHFAEYEQKQRAAKRRSMYIKIAAAA